ncbi:radical SAM protein [Candidatus Woesearchaeota archaeon]|nr:radical SAM protein [Candidatus Woesearchaeota archaeon]
MIQKTPYYSWKISNLPKGCQLCVKGEKTVLFITGLCSLKCFYCPISDQKKDKDVIYFNEWHSDDINNLFEEIKLCDSNGVGITGGDPLMKLERTVNYIKQLKKKFGKEFHIHLYTPVNLVAEDSLKKLYDAGLDEIRFHLDSYNNKFWKRLSYAEKFKWKIGVEIPVIPECKQEKHIIKQNYLNLIDFLATQKIDFLNFNELEISDTNACKLVEKGFRTKDRYSYGVKGSEELAKELLRYIDKKRKETKHKTHGKYNNEKIEDDKYNSEKSIGTEGNTGADYLFDVHYCTCRLKDAVQLRNRIKRRAKNAAKAYDEVDEDGMLIRGAVYYEKESDGKNIKKILKGYKTESKQAYEMNYDRGKKRVLTSKKIVIKLKNELRKYGKPAIVTEYPTHDCLNIETEFL